MTKFTNKLPKFLEKTQKILIISVKLNKPRHKIIILLPKYLNK